MPPRPMLLPSELPIVQAPMAGGPSTPELTAAVTRAGGFGFVAGGNLSVAAFAAELQVTRDLAGAPIGANLFVPAPPAVGADAAVAEYARLLAVEADRLATPLGDPVWGDDEYDAKLELLTRHPVHTVSFTFGCPDMNDIERLHSVESRVAVTVSSVGEAIWAQEAGADALVVQGTEAGGHQATFLADGPNTTPLLELLADVRDQVPLPLIAAGGISDGPSASAALDAGAVAVQIGTALLLADEARTALVHRAALVEMRAADSAETVLTRAFTGRYARGLSNRFARQYTSKAPAAYPQVHNLTRPLRAAAAAAGDPDVPNLWAGTNWRAAAPSPAADIVKRIATAARVGATQ